MPDLWRTSVEKVVHATPQQVFDLLADPRRHQEIDGSGTLQGVVEGPERLSQGAVFGMNMKIGAPYQMTNTVVEFEEGRRIAWQPRPTNGIAATVIGGRIWRYELEAVEGGTRVRETWDVRHEKALPGVLPQRWLVRKGMARTLERLEAVLR